MVESVTRMYGVKLFPLNKVNSQEKASMASMSYFTRRTGDGYYLYVPSLSEQKGAITKIYEVPIPLKTQVFSQLQKVTQKVRSTMDEPEYRLCKWDFFEDFDTFVGLGFFAPGTRYQQNNVLYMDVESAIRAELDSDKNRVTIEFEVKPETQFLKEWSAVNYKQMRDKARLSDGWF